MAKGTELQTVIAQGVRVEGDFVAEGDMIVEGEVRGTITTEGDLRVGQGAKIEANVRANNIVVSGDIAGTVHAAGKMELLASSRMSGDISAGVLAVEAGAQINGTMRMGADEAATNGKKTPKKLAVEEQGE